MSIADADVARAMEGDEAAYLRLVAASAGVVSSIALAVVRDRAASEDVAQEVFLAAWQNLRKLRNPASFLPWLRQVTRNQAHLWLRRRRNEVAVEGALLAAVDPRPAAADALIAEEERRVLRDVLAELPDDAREVVTLFYREGSSVAHVAELLGLSDAAVRQRLSRARARIREEMLARFGSAAARTAPAAAFVSVVAAGMTGAAPSAAAAVAAASVTKSAFALSIASLFGTLVGGIGFLRGWFELEPFFDEREKRELLRFSLAVMAVIAIASVVLPWTLTTPPPRWGAALVALAFAGAIGLMHFLWLPRILERRWAWEQELDPQVAAMGRRRWMRVTVYRFFSAVISGFLLMMLVVKDCH